MPSRARAARSPSGGLRASGDAEPRRPGEGYVFDMVATCASEGSSSTRRRSNERHGPEVGRQHYRFQGLPGRGSGERRVRARPPGVGCIQLGCIQQWRDGACFLVDPSRVTPFPGLGVWSWGPTAAGIRWDRGRWGFPERGHLYLSLVLRRSRRRAGVRRRLARIRSWPGLLTPPARGKAF